MVREGYCNFGCVGRLETLIERKHFGHTNFNSNKAILCISRLQRLRPAFREIIQTLIVTYRDVYFSGRAVNRFVSLVRPHEILYEK